MLKRINDALPGLVFGIVFYGIVVQLIGVWFVAIAVGMAVNIATVIYDATAIYGQKDANRRIVAKSLLRYIVVAVLLFILGLFDFGNLIMAFVGMLGLKISAYLQPLFMKVTDRFSGRSDASSAGEMETE